MSQRQYVDEEAPEEVRTLGWTLTIAARILAGRPVIQRALDVTMSHFPNPKMTIKMPAGEKPIIYDEKQMIEGLLKHCRARNIQVARRAHKSILSDRAGGKVILKMTINTPW